MVADVVAAGVGTISGIFEAFRGLNAIAKEMGKAEVIEQLTEAQSLFLQLQQQQMALVEEIKSLRDENRDLKERILIRQSVECHFGAYWTRDDEGRLDGPFTLSEWDDSQKLMRVAFRDHTGMPPPRLIFGVPNKPSRDIVVPIDWLQENGFNLNTLTSKD